MREMRERKTSSWKRTEIRQFIGQCRRLIAHRDIWFSVPQRPHLTVPALFWLQPTALDCRLIRQVPIPQSFCLSVYLSIYYCLAGNEKRFYLPICLSTCLLQLVGEGGMRKDYLYLPICLSVYLSVYVFPDLLKILFFFLPYSHRKIE